MTQAYIQKTITRGTNGDGPYMLTVQGWGPYEWVIWRETEIGTWTSRISKFCPTVKQAEAEGLDMIHHLSGAA